MLLLCFNASIIKLSTRELVYELLCLLKWMISHWRAESPLNPIDHYQY